MFPYFVKLDASGLTQFLHPLYNIMTYPYKQKWQGIFMLSLLAKLHPVEYFSMG